jgi:predicted dithiol-disulfide oxidoreductase (DUF899 family)
LWLRLAGLTGERGAGEEAMRFVCLGYADEREWEAMSQGEQEAAMEECLAYDDSLRKQGQPMGEGQALRNVRMAKTLRWKNGRVVVTDGPYAETKEQLGGFGVLEARDMDQAVELMSKHPGLRFGPFEIRPVDEEVNAFVEARASRSGSGGDGATAAQATGAALPRVVSRAEWLAAREALLVKEKEATRARDALNAERRRLPMVRIEKEYSFEGPRGKASLLDLFEGRRQLIVYHFMFEPEWDAGCEGCSMVVENMGHPAHLHARGVSRALVSRAPLSRIEPFKRRMGWTEPWYSSFGSDFNRDFGVTTDRGETFGLSIFLRDGGNVFHTYFTEGRGVELLGSNWSYLDLTPYGRQEEWEDSPPGWPQTPRYEWWRHHDEYDHEQGRSDTPG